MPGPGGATGISEINRFAAADAGDWAFGGDRTNGIGMTKLRKRTEKRTAQGKEKCGGLR